MGEIIMKTPTKEQIEQICKDLCFDLDEVVCDNHCYRCETGHWGKYAPIVKYALNRWEKIRS